MNRRTFIESACLVCAGVSILPFLPSCITNKFITEYTTDTKKITVKKSVFTTLKKEQTIQQKFVLIKPGNFAFSVAIYKIENEYKALLLKCTHQGCELNPYETMLVCPCHGAEFNTKGEVTQGPADIDLKSFITTYDDENIYIHL